MLIKITIENMPNILNDEIAQYVFDALSSWGGSFHPSNPLFNSLHINKITVRNINYDFSMCNQ